MGEPAEDEIVASSTYKADDHPSDVRLNGHSRSSRLHSLAKSAQEDLGNDERVDMTVSANNMHSASPKPAPQNGWASSPTSSQQRLRRRSARGLLSGTSTPNKTAGQAISGLSTPDVVHGGSAGNRGVSSAFLGQRLQDLATSLEDRLEEQSDKPGWNGEWARQLIDRGFWVEEQLEQEWELRKEAIGGIDNMWILLTDVSAFNPVCTATFVLQGKVDVAELQQRITKQVDTFPKYKQKLTNMNRKFHGSTFVDDPNWNVERHIEIHSLPGPASRDELDDFTAEFIARDWDFDKPLWEMAVIDNYKEAGFEGSALVTRGHHSMADGQGFVMSQLYISSFGPELERLLNEGKATLRAARRGKAKPSKLHKGLKPIDRYRHLLVVQIIMFSLFWTAWAIGAVLDMFNAVGQTISFTVHYALFSWRPLTLTSDYAGERVKEREFATSDRVSMAEVRKLQQAFSGSVPGGWIDRAFGRKQRSWYGHLTLNDIMCTVIADVLSDERDHQELVPAPTLRVRLQRIANIILPQRLALMIPISIRPVANWEMRNWSSGSLVWLPLPDAGKNKAHGLALGAKAMHARLHDVSRRLSTLKSGLLPTIAFWAVQITGQAPLLFPSLMWKPFTPIVKVCIESCLEAISAVVTNVPGPSGKEGISFSGQHVARWACSPPQAGKGTLGIGIISYADGICITIAADHVAGSPSDGVARRLAEKFIVRWQQYLQVADDILERSSTRRLNSSTKRGHFDANKKQKSGAGAGAEQPSYADKVKQKEQEGRA